MGFALKKDLLIEAIAFVIAMAVSAHFVHERIVFKDLPAGDEGSWMGTAAELSRGHNFSIRTLDWPFLEPQTIPRPNDTRFPAFVALLALAFNLFGISYKTGLFANGAIFLVFEVCFYFAVRAAFGRRAALIGLIAMVFSLNQLYWGTGVCTEGLYGAVFSLFILLHCRFPLQNRYHWIFLGIGLGLLWLVRPNTILFVPGLILYWFLLFRKNNARPQDLAISLGIMALICLPWMARNALDFGNPLQGAQSAGLLRANECEPLNYSLAEFLGMHGFFFPFKALVLGIGDFLHALHFHEHGLEIVPLAGVCVGIFRRKSFLSPLVLTGVILSFLMCAYICHHAWAAIRLFSPFQPFIYAYGISAILDEAGRFRAWPRPLFRTAVSVLLLAAVAAPVYYPHRFYERQYSGQRPAAFDTGAHFRLLERELGKDGIYWAGDIGQLNFLREFRCVMISCYYDSAAAERILTVLPPRLVAVKDDEREGRGMKNVEAAILRRGMTLIPAGRVGTVTYLRVEPSAPGTAP